MTRGVRRERPGRARTVAKVLAVTVLALTLVTGLSATFFYRHLNGNLDVAPLDDLIGPDRPDMPDTDGPRQPLNILVMGSDTREGEGNDVDTASGGGSDTTILVHLSADRQSAYGISIPRDSLVDRPECRTEDGGTVPGESAAIWNEAYSLGGPACTIHQLEQATGILVDNYVVVDFSGFRDMVDAVGGVEVCVADDLHSDEGDIDIPAGTRTMHGDEALDYIRIRYGVGDGTDLGRIRRQQAFIASLIDTVLSSGTLARVDRLVRFLDAATSSLTTDFTSVKELAELGLQFQDIGPNRIRFITVPWEYSTRQQGRVEWLPTADRLWDRIRHDQPLGTLRDDSVGVGPAPTAAPTGAAAPQPSVEADPSELADAGLCT